MWRASLGLCLLFAVGIDSIRGGCVFDKKKDFPKDNIPLLFSRQRSELVLPVMQNGNAVVMLAPGEPVVVSCPGSTIAIFGVSAVDATCVTGTTLGIAGTNYNLTRLECSGRPKESIQKTAIGCAGGGRRHDIGFEVQGVGFVPLINVCFHHGQETNLYSEHTVRGASIDAKDVVQGRASFKVDSGFFTVSPDTCYIQKQQKDLFEKTFDIPGAIDVSHCRYFAKGHMAPDADFVTELEQRATYYYINAVPQWQFFNNGNWKCVEFRVRKLAHKRQYNLTVITGTWEVLQMENTSRSPVSIFLGRTQPFNKAVLPAPLVTWKVIFDPSQNKTAAIVGVNSITNPLSSTVAIPCSSTSLCTQLKWLDGVQTNDPKRGVLYCCTADDLRKDVPYAPNFGGVPLLTN